MVTAAGAEAGLAALEEQPSGHRKTCAKKISGSVQCVLSASVHGTSKMQHPSSLSQQRDLWALPQAAQMAPRAIIQVRSLTEHKPLQHGPSFPLPPLTV